MTKRCTQCGAVKPLDDFNRRPDAVDGRRSYCRECQRLGRIARKQRMSPLRAEMVREASLETLELGRVPTAVEAIVSELGVCRSHPHPEWWTRDTVGPSTGRHAAKKACATCPARSACMVMVDHIESTLPLDRAYYSGIWAGEGPGDRALRRREERAREAA